MIKYTTILDKLSASLDFLEPGNDDILEVAEEGIRLAKDVMMEIRKDVISNKLSLKYRANLFTTLNFLPLKVNGQEAVTNLR